MRKWRAGRITSAGFRQPHQQRDRQRPLVAFEQRDVRRRDLQILGHCLLGQTKLAAHALEPGAEVEGLRVRHARGLSNSAQLYKEYL